MEIKIQLSAEARAVLDGLERAPKEMLLAVAAAMDLQNVLTVSHIQEKYLSFPKGGPAVDIGLRVQSNRYRGSLRASRASVSGGVVESSIGSNVKSKGVSYPAVHEFGAEIPAHKITAKGKALRFRIGDRVIFRKSVNIPAISLPARAPIQRGINDRLSAYGAAVSEAVIRGMSGGKPTTEH